MQQKRILTEPLPQDERHEETCEECGQAFSTAVDQPLKESIFRLMDRRLYRERMKFDEAWRNLCDLCLDKQQERQRREDIEFAAAAKREKREFNWPNICPVIYRESDPARLPADAVKNWARVVDWKYQERGLILIGPTGAGKTRLCYALLRRLYVEQGHSCKLFKCADFAHELLEIASEGYGAKLRPWLKAICEADVLFLDDFGKMRFSEKVATELFGIVEKRTANGLPIIISTNDTSDTLADRMGDMSAGPLIRRLREFNDTITLTNKPQT